MYSYQLPIDIHVYALSLTVWVQFQRDSFRPPPPRLGVKGEMGVWRWAHSIAQLWVPISSPLTHTVYLLPFFSYLAGSESVFVRPPARPPVRPGYDDKYRSRSQRFVERQNYLMGYTRGNEALELQFPKLYTL